MVMKKSIYMVIVILIIYGLTAISCNDNRVTTFLTVEVEGIPPAFNGQNFTISLISLNQVALSRNGIVAGNRAEADLGVTFDDSNRIIDLRGGGGFGYIMIKIGDNTSKVSKNPVGFPTYIHSKKSMTTEDVEYRRFWRLNYTSDFND